MQNPRFKGKHRRGAIVVFAAVLLVVVFAFVAFTVDIGYMAVIRCQLQLAADSAALGSAQDIPAGQNAVRASARDLAGRNEAAGVPVSLADQDIELGYFDFESREFVVDPMEANAVRVTAKANDQDLFFAPIIGHHTADLEAQSIAMLNPRDIVFVVDLSGSMNDDTEPCWATDALTAQFTPAGYPDVANQLMQQVYNDFGYGQFPGDLEYLGAPLGVRQDHYAYADLTRDDGPLSDASLSDYYRIEVEDEEWTRKRKAYCWMIDHQIARVMPNVQPVADSTKEYEYWSRYLDYLVQGAVVGEPPPPPPPTGGGGGTVDPPPPPPTDPPPPKPPTTGSIEHRRLPLRLATTLAMTGRVSVATLLNAGNVWGSLTSLPPVSNPAASQETTWRPGCPRRGGEPYVWIPPSQDGDRIYNFNNPNRSAFPSASSAAGWRNWIGYRTYVQYMMDWGRNRSPAFSNSLNANPALLGKTPLSVLHPACPRHNEMTAGGSFKFPPRTQPMHAVRRSLIAGIKLIADKNAFVAAGAGDRVSIVTFDALDAWHSPEVVLPLTDNFQAAMQACTNLQAAADVGASTATEAGLRLARRHLANKTTASNPDNDPTGPSGRSFAKRVIVLLTDGMPNLWESDAEEIDGYIEANSSSEYYPMGYDWLNAPLMQAGQFQALEKGMLFSVGMGLGADYDFMDRMARTARTAEGGQSPRGSGNPAQYESTLTRTLEAIILRPGSKLVR